MRRALATLLWLLAGSAGMHAQSPVVRAHLEPSSKVMVGQPVRMPVTVYVPNYFTGEPNFPEFEIENAIVVLPQDRPENSNTTINGVQYAGITETYVIYPQQAGDFHLPPAMISVVYASAPPKTTTTQLRLPGLSFHADIPAAAKDLDYFLPTTSLTIKQQWSSPMTQVKVGDSINRTITVTATRTQSMLIPPTDFAPPDGIRVYAQKTAVNDHKTPRGDFVYGQRTETVTYFIQKPGHYTLPPVEIKWWNLSSQRLVTATLPAVHFTAAPNPNAATELPPEAEPVAVAPVKHVSAWKKYRKIAYLSIVWVVVAGVVLLLVLNLGPRFIRDTRAWMERRRHSKAAYFRHLRYACMRNQPVQAYQWLLRWTARAYPGRTVEQMLRRSGDAELRAEVDTLSARLFGEAAQEWNGKRMFGLLKQERKRVVHSEAKGRLAELNPDS